MKYPSHTDYKDAVLAPQDYFDRLKDLRPVLNGRGDPVQDSGNFAVVYKMTDGVRNYAVKCFTKEQKGRREAYRSICGYMSALPSPYMARIEYLEKELFVDGEEYPVLVMDWVEGVKLDSYVKTIRDDRAKCARLADEFRGLALWLMSQEFAHGDLKPDNIIVTEGGRLMLVDYDGMFVPSMRGQKARELGTPPYRFKGRTLRDFDEYADDYACVFILLVLVTGMFEPVDFEEFAPLADARDIVSRFAAYFENARVAPYIAAFLLVASCGRLNRQALYPLLSRRSGALESESPLPGNLVASIARAPSASDPLTFNVNGVSFEMVPVEGGTFTMGATPEQEEDAFDDE